MAVTNIEESEGLKSGRKVFFLSTARVISGNFNGSISDRITQWAGTNAQSSKEDIGVLSTNYSMKLYPRNKVPSKGIVRNSVDALAGFSCEVPKNPKGDDMQVRLSQGMFNKSVIKME